MRQDKLLKEIKLKWWEVAKIYSFIENDLNPRTELYNYCLLSFSEDAVSKIKPFNKDICSEYPFDSILLKKEELLKEYWIFYFIINIKNNKISFIFSNADYFDGFVLVPKNFTHKIIDDRTFNQSEALKEVEQELKDLSFFLNKEKENYLGLTFDDEPSFVVLFTEMGEIEKYLKEKDLLI